VLWTDESMFQLVLGEKLTTSLSPKDHPDCHQQHIKSKHLSWYGCASVPMS